MDPLYTFCLVSMCALSGSQSLWYICLFYWIMFGLKKKINHRSVIRQIACDGLSRTFSSLFPWLMGMSWKIVSLSKTYLWNGFSLRERFHFQTTFYLLIFKKHHVSSIKLLKGQQSGPSLLSWILNKFTPVEII